MREDVAAIVQLLLVVVQSTRGQLPYTQNEYKKTWEKIFLQIYVHADRLAHKLHDEEGTGHDVKRLFEKRYSKKVIKRNTPDLHLCAARRRWGSSRLR